MPHIWKHDSDNTHKLIVSQPWNRFHRSRWIRFARGGFTAAGCESNHHPGPIGWKHTGSCHHTYWGRPNTGRSFTNRLRHWPWLLNVVPKRTCYAPSCTNGPAMVVADSSLRTRRSIGGITRSSRKKRDAHMRYNFFLPTHTHTLVYYYTANTNQWAGNYNIKSML